MRLGGHAVLRHRNKKGHFTILLPNEQCSEKLTYPFVDQNLE